LADPKLGEREVLAAMLDHDADLVDRRVPESGRVLLICDKGFAGAALETELAGCGVQLLRPSCKDEQARCGEPMLKKVRQLIESVNDTLKGHLDLEGHGGRTVEGVTVRIADNQSASLLARISHDRSTDGMGDHVDFRSTCR
jgi:hypothetical protein